MALKLGQQAPNFDAEAYVAGKFKRIKFSDYRGKWLVLFFYPRDFTFVCPTELKGFADKESEFERLRARIVAVSTDSKWSHKAWFERDLPTVKYPVIADTGHTISEEYGVLDENTGDAQRGAFIIDAQGIIRYLVVSSSSVGRSVSETLRVLRALQTGDLCPVDWQEGQSTLGRA